MKFTDGQWLTKPNHVFLHPQQLFDVSYCNNEMTVYVYTNFVEGRSQTLDQGTFTIHFTTEQVDTISIKSNHYEGIRKKGPEFNIISDKLVKAIFEENDDSYSFQSGKLKALVTKVPFSINYYYDGK